VKASFRVFFQVVGLVLLLAGCFTQVMELGQDFSDRVNDRISDTGMVNLSDFTDFDWDKLIIIGPYMNVNNVLAETDVTWQRPIRHIEHSDTIILLLFAFDNRVVAFSHFPRTPVTQVMPMGTSIDRHEAIFVIDLESP